MSEPVMVKRLEIFAGGSVNDIVDWCVQHGLSPSDVTVTACHVRWESPQTDKEGADRAYWQARQDERQQQWERETYERLHAKFAPAESSGVS